MSEAPVSTDVVDNDTNVEVQDTNVLEIAERVRRFAERGRVNAAQLASGLAISGGAAANYFKGVRPWPSPLLPRLATLLDVTVGEIFGEGVLAHADFVTVDEIDLTYGLGGTFSDMPVETQKINFERAWLEGITTTQPSLLTFARGRGDSMQPTIQDGDIVLIDRSTRSVREQDAIWAITIGDIAMIKRLRVRGERVSILSDNDRVPDDLAHFEEINVVGRVVFIGRKL